MIAGNWKMNKTVEEAVDFVREIRRPLSSVEGVDIVICPPFVALPAVQQALKANRIDLGAQNMHFEDRGAFTGECSPEMLAPLCQFVILGHSERRQYFGETDSGVNKKVKKAIEYGITPIVCVGESLQQNESGETHSFVSNQVRAAFEDIPSAQVGTCIIAYEPIWAIGTGLSASPVDAGRIIGVTVRGAVADLYGERIAEKIRVLYGGSANAANIAEYLTHADIDGALVGGASLKSEFVDMVRIASQTITSA